MAAGACSPLAPTGSGRYESSGQGGARRRRRGGRGAGDGGGAEAKLQWHCGGSAAPSFLAVGVRRDEGRRALDGSARRQDMSPLISPAVGLRGDPEARGRGGGGVREAETEGVDANAIYFSLCWRRWPAKEIANTVHVRQKLIFLPFLHYVIGVSLTFLNTFCEESPSAEIHSDSHKIFPSIIYNDVGTNYIDYHNFTIHDLIVGIIESYH
jgi:hypothetical protein